jgi:uncharacterized zinc-type alcohol dehydrogenase-like protein
MSTSINAYACLAQGKPLEPFEYDPGELEREQVEIRVSHCGLCHSDLSMLENEWGFTKYPLVPGHEVIGTIIATGDAVKRVKVGQRVGLGWYSRSCMACYQCLSGRHHLCETPEQTIVHRHGGFADRVRCHWVWATPLPEALDLAKAGPLFCGGSTVFNPIDTYGVKPTDRVGVIGIGGLGHLALQFLNKWGCHVTAFSSSASKHDEAKRMGAHAVVDSRDTAQMKKLASSLNFILCTANAALDWPAYIETLAPGGRLNFVGIVPKPIQTDVMPLIGAQRSISGSPVGSPAMTERMIAFCARHHIEPVTELFPMSKVNDAFEHLREGKARYRIVLENDLD